VSELVCAHVGACTRMHLCVCVCVCLSADSSVIVGYTPLTGVYFH
jgi:hypothetical protein